MILASLHGSIRLGDAITTVIKCMVDIRFDDWVRHGPSRTSS